MGIPAHIFREYDIRGVVGEDLDPGVAEAVGRAYGSELSARLAGPVPRVVVGADNRPSSPVLRGGLVRGLRSAGCNVIQLGTVPTPVAYFSEYEFAADGAVQITGSHNPPEYNGIKMTMGKGSVYGDAIQGLLRRIRTGDVAVGDGGLETVDPLPAYVADVSGRFRIERPVKAVVDCGNGTGAVVAVELLGAVGFEVVPLYCESDGTFPNHHPDPTVDEYVQDLIAAVRDHGAEVGIGFDGDADRIGVVDDRGRIVRGDILLLLFGLDLLRRRGPGQTLVFDVKCSQVLAEEFERAGGVPLMWKTGHSLIKEKMKETGALMAGELSGHICFADSYYGFDDAPYAACRLGELLAASDRPLSAMVGAFPEYASTPELRIEVAEEDKFGIVDRARGHFRAGYDVIAVDGVRVLFGDGWGLIRASNTQPVIVARFEARTRARLAEIQETMGSWLRSQGVAV
ncbi:MAG: phosphomannomutase/phosphoglucomutase [Gemmatimonadota bacterium]|nr:phosphomannomutase/phosphoglucomutase [Gemmatimonadota bacterium]